jgi:hypothetical protein
MCNDVDDPRRDETPNYFLGLSDKWHFKTEDEPDIVPPFVDAFNIPVPGSNVTVRWTKFQFRVNEPVKVSGGGRIMIFKKGVTNAIWKSYGNAVSSADPTKPIVNLEFIRDFKGVPRATIGTFEIPPWFVKDYDSQYYILFERDTFQDMANNTLVAMNNVTAWTFKTETAPDVTPPKLTSLWPNNLNDTIPILDTWNILLTFSEPIQLNYLLAGPAVVFTTVPVNPGEVPIVVASLAFNTLFIKQAVNLEIRVPKKTLPKWLTWYSISLAGNLIRDKSGNFFTSVPAEANATITSDAFKDFFPYNRWEVRTMREPDLNGPLLLSAYPVRGNLTHPAPRYRIPIDKLTLRFSEKVMMGTGFITIYDSKLKKTVSKLDAKSKSYFKQEGNNTVIFLPQQLKNYDTVYFVIIQSSCITDTSYNSFPGFYDSSQWALFKKYGAWTIQTQLEPKVILSHTTVTVAEGLFNTTYSMVLSTKPGRISYDLHSDISVTCYPLAL